MRLESIDDGAVRLAGPLYRAVLEVSGASASLDDDVRREGVLAGYATFLNGLNFPIQVLVRSVPVDLARYLSGIEDRARTEPADELAALARDHVAFVQGLARQRTLLERRLYLVIPAQTARPTGWDFGTWFRRDAAGLTPDQAAAHRQLSFRCDEVTRQLARSGVMARRLDDAELAQLYMACWAPERSRLQRVRQRLADYAALAVQGPTRADPTDDRAVTGALPRASAH
jgi:hypothetical protein